jgi:hypothetical protein
VEGLASPRSIASVSLRENPSFLLPLPSGVVVRGREERSLIRTATST